MTWYTSATRPTPRRRTTVHFAKASPSWKIATRATEPRSPWSGWIDGRGDRGTGVAARGLGGAGQGLGVAVLPLDRAVQRVARPFQTFRETRSALGGSARIPGVTAEDLGGSSQVLGACSQDPGGSSQV